MRAQEAFAALAGLAATILGTTAVDEAAAGFYIATLVVRVARPGLQHKIIT